MSTVTKDRQLQLAGEQSIENADLEGWLDERETRKETPGTYRKQFTESDEKVRAKIKELGIRGRVRCGAFVITVTEKPGRAVSFETAPATQIKIALAKDAA